ncbi:hypothetical protein RchiOBHm_Chr3g0485851 [Rosa chinensis]|uniref:Uncharacterized protein n=1 Tax=Rosa chinensis TaxID=74649 RepID=A0A2P6RF46_ROSCH|nr:hypothetical protein RchiOBHm_Chr3g0485851 [Rosa chinensis]
MFLYLFLLIRTHYAFCDQHIDIADFPSLPDLLEVARNLYLPILLYSGMSSTQILFYLPIVLTFQLHPKINLLFTLKF